MGLLYHYTSLHTLCAIVNGIQSGEMFLRAGNAKNMNDPNDCYYFINMLGILTDADENQVKQISEEKLKYDCPYLVSLSKHKDDLHMWNCYGDDGCGVAIGIKDVDNLVNDFYSKKHLSSHLYKCRYMDVKKVKNNKPLWNLIKERDFFDKDFWMSKEISEVSNIIKHPCYRYEKEYRIVILHGDNEIIIGGDRTYNLEEDAFYLNVPLSSVTQIIVGPCANYESVKKVFSPFFTNAKFIKSKIPYRRR